ncbi:MAG: hypothetical protein AAFU64_00275 [Bacteroidota bacterium]
MNQQTKTDLSSQLDSRFWKISFLIIGLLTAFGVLPSIVDPVTALKDFSPEVEINPFTAYLFRTFFVMVCAMGLCYVLLASRPSRYPGLAILGMLGKFSFALGVFLHYSSGILSPLALIIAFLDTGMGVIFALFVMKYFRG